MSDRHRTRPPHRNESLVAAARLLAPTPHDKPNPEAWHQEAWAFRDTVGELRFAESWLANTLSRSRLFAAKRPAPGAEPEPLEDGPAFELVAELAGGVGGQSDLLRSFAAYLMIPGVAFLVGEAKEHGAMFKVVNSEDLRLGQDEENNPAYELREGEQAGDWRQLPLGSLVTKVYRQHPRHRWLSDSPTRAALPILRELLLLTQAVEATATSRLAGAGTQFLPQEMELPDGWDAFIEEWIRVTSKPIKDRSLTAAHVPFPVRIPGQYLAAMKDAFVTYSTPFDEQALMLRQEGITRLGTAMDMPRQILTGEQTNHWGQWQIEESGLKLHAEPGLEVICEGLTVGYLSPGLDAATETSEAAASEITRELTLEETPLAEFIVWYDTSDLRVRPDRSEAAQQAYDRFEVDGDTLRRELGLSEAEAARPTDPEVQRRIWYKLLDSETHVDVALKKLGLIDDDDVPKPVVASPSGNGRQPRPAEEEEPAGGRGLPETGDEQPNLTEPPGPPARATVDVPDDVAALSLSPGVALLAACDLLVDRALEVAGKRVLTKLPASQRPSAGRCPAARLHTCVDTDAVVPIAMQFVGAWDRLPEIAERLGEDLDGLRAALDGYVTVLVRTRQPHGWDALSEALGVCPCEEEP